MSTAITQPIEGPAVWHGEELARSPGWVRPVTPRFVEELDAALRAVERRGLRWPGFGGSAGPPAKHWAIDIQRVATSPVTRSAVSATLRTWVTTWQKSRAAPSMRPLPLSSFHSQIAPDGAVRRTRGGGPGTSRPRFTKVQAKVFTPITQMWRMRSVGTRSTRFRS